MPAMRRGVTVLLVALCGAALTGCPDWSRPDPALRRRAADDGASPSTSPTSPTSPATPTSPTAGGAQAPARGQGTTAAGLEDLRAGVARLRESLGEPDALRRLERLETLGFDLLERGRADEQAEVEALLQELSDLRLEVVDLPGGGQRGG